jgi:hypothetical protein
MGKFMLSGLAAVVAIVVIAATSGSENETAVIGQEQYGAEWPWPDFERGILSCERDAVFVTLAGKKYALNGKAQGGDYPPASDLQLREPGTERISADGKGIFRRAATSDIIQEGLRLCK